jgi:transcriptional regulator with XRE-family HTH domain
LANSAGMGSKKLMWKAAGAFDKLLKEKGITSAEVARLVKVSGATISRYRSGERAPDPDSLAAICQTLGISADELLGLDVSEQRAADHLAREVARLVKATEKLSAAARRR